MPLEGRLRRFVIKGLRRLGAWRRHRRPRRRVMARYLRHRPVHYKPWLERTMRSVVIDAWRRGSIRVDGERRTVRLEGLPPPSFVSDRAGGPPAALPPALLASSLSTPVANRDVARRLLDALTPPQRAVVDGPLLGGPLQPGHRRPARLCRSTRSSTERRLRDRFPGGIDAVG